MIETVNEGLLVASQSVECSTVGSQYATTIARSVVAMEGDALPNATADDTRTVCDASDMPAAVHLAPDMTQLLEQPPADATALATASAITTFTPFPLNAATEAAALDFLYERGLRPSGEQTAVVHALLEGRHVTVNAVAGSGKTTTVLFLAAYLLAERRGRRILLLTYNKDLKEETRIRVEMLGLRSQVEAHSFHAAGYKYYSYECAKDQGLRHCVLSECTTWRAKPGPYDFVVIDEAQDVDRLKFAFTARLVQKSLVAGRMPPQFLVIGDERQAIYDYAGADVRFLRLADRGVWSAAGDARPWARLKLTTSFRITPQMAMFVSDIMLRSPGYIVSSRSWAGAVKVDYWVGSAFANARRVAKEIIALVRMRRCGAGEIFILASSVKQAALKLNADYEAQTPMQVINQLLSEERIPCRVTLSDADACAKEDSVGYVLFSTMNQAKGRERRLVYVLGFSVDYFAYSARDAPRTQCPNLLYVACTRAKERLVLVAERYEGDCLPFLDVSRHDSWARAVKHSMEFEQRPLEPQSEQPLEAISAVPVTELLTHQAEFVLSRALARVSFECRRKAAVHPVATARDPAEGGGVSGVIILPPRTESDVMEGGHERVSDINGLALESMLEIYTLKHREPRVLQVVRERLTELTSNVAVMRKIGADFHKLIAPINWSDSTPVEAFLRLTAMYKAIAAVGTAGLLTAYTQIKKFDWLPRTAVDLALKRIAHEIGPSLQCGAMIEVEHSHLVPLPPKMGIGRFVELQGVCDVETADGNEIFELKATHELSDSHKLQLVCYAYLHLVNVQEHPLTIQTSSNVHNGSSSERSESSSTTSPANPLRNTGSDSCRPCGEIPQSRDSAVLDGAYRPPPLSSTPPHLPYSPSSCVPHCFPSAATSSTQQFANCQKEFTLLNVLTGERWRLVTKDLGCLQEAVEILVEGKYGERRSAGDDTFVRQAERLRCGVPLNERDLDNFAVASAKRGRETWM